MLSDYVITVTYAHKHKHNKKWSDTNYRIKDIVHDSGYFLFKISMELFLTKGNSSSSS